MASSSTSALSEEVLWEELPEELLLRVLGQAMLEYGEKRWSAAVRGVSRRWRALHDGACQSLRVLDGVTDEGMYALCARLPALTFLELDNQGVVSLTENGLRAVGDLTTLTELYLSECSGVTDLVLWELRDRTALARLSLENCTNVTDVGVRELRGLTAITHLYLTGCLQVTDSGLRHLTSLTALVRLRLFGTSTTQAGRVALKAALPALLTYL
jgi:hypothetical protein